MQMLTPPREEMLPAWRAAVLAFKREYQASGEDRNARAAAFEAFRQILPNVPEDEAKRETNHAIVYAATYHRDWFWGP